MFLARLRKDLRRWRECRRSTAELSKLTPRQLEDIGLAPYEVEDAVRGRIRR